MTTAPVKVMPAPKKPIQINPALLDAIYQALLKTDMKAEGEELEAALVKPKQVIWHVRYHLGQYQREAKRCGYKQYTTEDQKKAGCVGTDTLNQCSTKLFNHCFSYMKNHAFLKYRKEMLEASDRLDKALKAYTVKLKMIPEPK